MILEFLEKIKNPENLKNLTFEQLNQLAKEIRQAISAQVRETGGHLGPNLGVVELTIACHLVFDLSKDRLVFDVGHQSYPHKLLTGRFSEFNTLRQKGGLSGYPHYDESVYDVFRTGHASTSISTSLGIARGYRSLNEKQLRNVIALIGDGSLTGGMAFEGLNHSGALKEKLIVLLNDNSMSISPTVGGLSNTFNRLRHNRVLGTIVNDIHAVVKKVPKFGNDASGFIQYFRNATRHLMSPGTLFNDLGFDYYGPVDGHNIKELKEALETAKTTKEPIVVHILTDKGKDYHPNGQVGETTVGPHALSPGTRLKEEKQKEGIVENASHNWSLAFGRILKEKAAIDSKICAITAAMAEGTGLISFGNSYKERFYDVGICEQHAVGLAAGLSYTGLKPIFAVYSTFLQRAIDQVFHEFLLQEKLPLLLCIDRAGLVGDDGPSHHGLYDIALLRAFPNMVLMAPRDEIELEEMIEWWRNNPCVAAIRYPRQNLKQLTTEEVLSQKKGRLPIHLGNAELLATSSEKKHRITITLFAYGSMVLVAEEVMKHFINSECVVQLVNARFAKPIDTTLLRTIFDNSNYVFTLEEGVVIGGLGTAVAEFLEDYRIEKPTNNPFLIRIGVPDKFIEHASRIEQMRECGLDVESIIEKIKSIIFR